MPHLKGFHFWWNGAKDTASSSNVLVSFVAAWLSIKEAEMSPKTSSSLFTMWIVTGREEKRTMVLIRVWICNSNSFLCGQQRLFAWLKTVFLDGKKNSRDSLFTYVSAQIWWNESTHVIQSLTLFPTENSENVDVGWFCWPNLPLKTSWPKR